MGMKGESGKHFRVRAQLCLTKIPSKEQDRHSECLSLSGKPLKLRLHHALRAREHPNLASRIPGLMIRELPALWHEPKKSS